MRWSHYFIPTLKEVPVGTEARSHQLSLRAGLVHMLTSGVYTYLPLGLRVLARIERIIREEMNQAGAHELFMPCLQPLDIWQKTGRDKVLSDVMIKFEDGKGRKMCLGPTHEEIVTDLVKNFIQSYRQLPVTLYQIQTKFRDELRPRFGIVRACEFIMKDAYSFDRDKSGLEKNYKKMYQAYINIFKRLGLQTSVLSADSGAMGGDVSHEFMVAAPIGEDVIISCDQCDFESGARDHLEEKQACPECQKGQLTKQAAIELGHIFQLGTKYTQSLGALYLDEDGKLKPIIMGCYGIGVSRVIAALIEVHNDEQGIIWPAEVAPFDIEILPLMIDHDETMLLSESFYQDLSEQGFAVLVDDRKESPGRKFNDADLIGIPWRIILGKRALSEGQVEIKNRRSQEVIKVPKDQVIDKLKSLLA
ncbi:MAG: proline--tRNA ligase [Candidatus Omnitrophica bacterium]|nr:proline--tRNA ligase [Candidatus Omnitrophota bacterium]